MATHDKFNNEYAKFSELKDGQTVYADNDFPCLPPGPHIIYKDASGFFVRCDEGEHYLNDDEGDYLVGWYTKEPSFSTNKSKDKDEDMNKDKASKRDKEGTSKKLCFRCELNELKTESELYSLRCDECTEFLTHERNQQPYD